MMDDDDDDDSSPSSSREARVNALHGGVGSYRECTFSGNAYLACGVSFFLFLFRERKA